MEELNPYVASVVENLVDDMLDELLNEPKGGA